MKNYCDRQFTLVRSDDFSSFELIVKYIGKVDVLKFEGTQSDTIKCKMIFSVIDYIKEKFNIILDITQIDFNHILDNIYSVTVLRPLEFYEDEYFCENCNDTFIAMDLKRGKKCPVCNNKNLKTKEVYYVIKKRFYK